MSGVTLFSLYGARSQRTQVVEAIAFLAFAIVALAGLGAPVVTGWVAHPFGFIMKLPD